MSTVDIAEGRRLLAAARRVVDAWFRPSGTGGWDNEWEWTQAMTGLRAAVNAEALLAGTPDLPSRDELGAVIRDTLGQWAGQTIPPWPSDWSWLIADEVLRRLREAPDGPCPVCAHFGHGTADHGLTPVREAPDGR